MKRSIGDSRPYFNFIATLLLSCVCADSAWAGIVGIDVGGAAPTGWHQLFVGTDLTDESGGPTDIDVSLNRFGEVSGQSINGSTLPTHTPTLEALNSFDAIFFEIHFGGLNAGEPYNIWIFSLYNVPIEPATFNATVTGGGAPQVISFLVDTAGDLVINGVTGNSAEPLEAFAAVVSASASGTIDITFSNNSGSNADMPIAGVAIGLVVPEPSAVTQAATFGLLLLGSGMWRSRRRV